MVNTIKVTISGSYRAGNGDIEDYEQVTGVMPALDEDKINQMAIKRYAPIWISQAKDKDGSPKYKHIKKIRQVFVDSVDDNPNTILPYVGKNIMDMDWFDLQDLASAKDLSAVPIYRTVSLTHARRVAFSEYAIKILGLEEYAPDDKRRKSNLYDYKVNGFSPSRFKPIIADSKVIRASGDVADIEDIIVAEGVDKLRAPDQVESRLTLQQLKLVAESKGVKFHPNIGFDALFAKTYPKAA